MESQPTAPRLFDEPPPPPEPLPGEIRYEAAPIRARVAQALLVANAVFYFAVFFTAFAEEAVAAASQTYWGVMDAVDPFITPTELLLRAVTAIAFLRWLHRASQNTYALSREPPEHASQFAVGCWFIPCGNLWLPYQVVREIDAKCDPENLGVASSLVTAWWAAWVAFSVGSRFVRGEASDPLFALALCAVEMVAAILAALVIERIQKNQAALAARRDVHAIAAEFA